MDNVLFCSGQDHVISLHAYIRQEDHVALIMPYFQHDKFVVSECMTLLARAPLLINGGGCTEKFLWARHRTLMDTF